MFDGMLGRAQSIPAWSPKTPAEIRQEAAGKARYLAAKKARQVAAEASAKAKARPQAGATKVGGGGGGGGGCAPRASGGSGVKAESN